MEELSAAASTVLSKLSNWFEFIVSWISNNFLPFLLEVPYYLGLGTGILIGAIIFGLITNKLLTYLTYRYEISSFGTIKNPPSFTEDEKKLLKETLLWWNEQCDGWYTTSTSKVDDSLNGRKINLIDVIRIRDSTQLGKSYKRFCPTEETQKVFDCFEDKLKLLELELKAEVDHKKLTRKIIKETDVLSKQLKIAQYSAFAALASAIAAGLATYLTYLNHLIDQTIK